MNIVHCSVNYQTRWRVKVLNLSNIYNETIKLKLGLGKMFLKNITWRER